jgi:hypothetical protein
MDSKTYGASYSLLIYLNLSGMPDGTAALTSMFAPATALARDRFADVWVLWNGDVFNVWHRGAPSGRTLRAVPDSYDSADERSP